MTHKEAFRMPGLPAQTYHIHTHTVYSYLSCVLSRISVVYHMGKL